MDLYFGGAYNGKLKYIREDLNISEENIFYCKDNKIDFSKKVICGLHIFIYNNIMKKTSSIEFIEENIDKLKDSIIICDDLSSGIVPLKKEDRIWREETGKVLQFLSSNSNTVTRVFCGIPQVLKS